MIARAKVRSTPVRRAEPLDHASVLSALLNAIKYKADCVILLDASAAPVLVNDAAARLLKAKDGLSYVDGVLAAWRTLETLNLHKRMGEVIAGSGSIGADPGGQMLISRPSGKRPYIVRVVPALPIEGPLAPNRVACVIHVQDLSKVNVPAKKSLCQVFGLTAREADFAVELVRCSGLDGAAVNAHMAVNTARNHLQSIFRKTGTATQAEAVQLFGRIF